MNKLKYRQLHKTPVIAIERQGLKDQTQTNKKQKKRRFRSASAAASAVVPVVPDLENDITGFDWCVRQVKYQHVSTNTLIQQYWHWVNEPESSSEENIFEHQIRKYNPSDGKATWGAYKNYNFHLRLAELTENKFATNCQKIIIGTREINGKI